MKKKVNQTISEEGDFDQRPPIEEARKILLEMLKSAIIQAYSSGSVGCTEAREGPQETFCYSVTFQIRRRRRFGTVPVKATDFTPLDTDPPSYGSWP